MAKSVRYLHLSLLTVHPIPAPAQAWAHVGAGRAAPQVGDLTQVLRQVILVLCLGSQLQVPAERIQPHGVGPAGGEWG